jgi:hypothetical protein
MKGYVIDHISEFDIAMVILDEAIGYKTGWAGIFCTEDDGYLSGRLTTLTGYPADKPDGQMWTMSDVIKHVSSEQLFYEISTYSDNSGSCICFSKEENVFVLGAHAGGREKPDINYGTRISIKKFNSIVDWLEKYNIVKGIYNFNLINGGKVWEIKTVLEGGKIGLTTDIGSWWREYHQSFPFEVNEKMYCLTYRNPFANPCPWYIYKFLKGGKLSSETSFGETFFYQNLMIPLEIKGKKYCFMHRHDSTLKNAYCFHELLDGGKMRKICSSSGSFWFFYRYAFSFILKEETYICL